MIRHCIAFLLSLVLVSAGYHCRTPTDCTITCSNFRGNLPKPWIAVPYDTGHCYFHNTETREDRDTPPSLRRVYK